VFQNNFARITQRTRIRCENYHYLYQLDRRRTYNTVTGNVNDNLIFKNEIALYVFRIQLAIHSYTRGNFLDNRDFKRNKRCEY